MSYTLSSTELGYVELDRKDGVYDEHPPIGGLRLFESRVSDAAGLFPNFLLPTSTKSLLGQPVAIVPVPGRGDELQVEMNGPMGRMSLHLLVDPEGRPAEFSSMGQGGKRSWRLLSFKPGQTDLATYRVEPPLGFVPFALPELPFPLQVGEEAPLTGWKKGGKPIDLGEPQRGKTRLLAVLGADCPASKAVRPVLTDLAKSLPVLLIGPGEIVDPSGSLMKKLSPPGTPMFYLVGPDQKVTHLWFGFDADKVTAWSAAVRKAAAGK